MNKKILYIATRFPFPVKGGREKMIEQTLRFLSKEFDIYLAFFSKRPVNLKPDCLLRYNIKQIVSLNFPNVLEILLNQVLRYRTSLQERLFFSRQNMKKLISFIRKTNPDIIITDMIRTAQYMENLNLRKILDMDDLLSIRYERYKSQSLKETKLLGNFQDLLPGFFSNLLEFSFKSWILNYESKKIKNREVELAKKFDVTFLVSPKEVKKLREHTGLSNIYPLPPSVEIHENIYNPRLRQNNFLFIGNMKTSQNLSSLKFIIDEIFPNLIKKIDLKLKIVGTYDDRLINVVKPYKGYVDILGFVKDLEDVMKNSKLLLSPIAFGTGIKTKILDAMSYGLPVVTNSVGAEGLDVKNNVHCIIEDDPLKLSEEIVKLIENPSKLILLSWNGYRYVLENHHPEKIKKNLLKVMKVIMEVK